MSVIKGWENLPKSTEIYRNLLKSPEVYGKLDTCLHQTPFTPDNFYTKQLYNKQLLDQAPFTPETFCTEQLLRNSLSGAAMIWDSVETKGKKKHTESILMLFLLGCIRLQLFQGYASGRVMARVSEQLRATNLKCSSTDSSTKHLRDQCRTEKPDQSSLLLAAACHFFMVWREVLLKALDAWPSLCWNVA